ncbi:MAG TPA: hypothetical protein VKU80_09205, partial [Planctomycetota bacterium]|nr:hypothetical protein [Planctomycetota bacterium]
SNLEDVQFDSIKFVGDVTGYGQVQAYIMVQTSNWVNLKVQIRFPQNGKNGSGGSGQTQRSWGSGTPNNFFVSGNPTQDSLRATDRNNFNASFEQTINTVLAQAGLNLYDIPNSDLLEFPAATMFNAQGEFIDQTPTGAASAQLQTLYQSYDQPGDPTHNLINIYLVYRLQNSYGCTWSKWNIKRTGTTVVIADDAPAFTEAHEIFHLLGPMGIRHIESWDDLSGGINNLKDVLNNKAFSLSNPADPSNPLNWNLMRESEAGRRTDSAGNRLTDEQVKPTRDTARYVHPAFKNVD